MHQFEAFVEARRGDLRRIAYATKGEMELGDIINDAWLIAMEIGEGMDEPFDFSCLEHQNKLLAWLGARHGKYADKTVRYAVKLDRGWDQPEEEKTGAALSRVLSGPESDDPLVRGLIEDQADELMTMVRASYSHRLPPTSSSWPGWSGTWGTWPNWSGSGGTPSGAAWDGPLAGWPSSLPASMGWRQFPRTSPPGAEDGWPASDTRPRRGRGCSGRWLRRPIEGDVGS